MWAILMLADPVTEGTAVSIGLLVALFGGLVTIIKIAWDSKLELVNIKNEQRQISAVMRHLLTKQEHESWVLRFKAANPGLAVPDPDVSAQTPRPSGITIC